MKNAKGKFSRLNGSMLECLTIHNYIIAKSDY